MGSRLSDFRSYAHLWGTPELRALFDEEAVLQRWLDVLVALARAQADLGIVPDDAARTIAARARVSELDLDRVAEATRATGHSTLGLIQELRGVLPAAAREWVYYGATVQDVTDSASAIALREVAALVDADLAGIEERTLALAARHRDTVQVGRTHGQPGAPITFGWKAAGWADEIGRHRRRLAEAAPRFTAGQLGGAVGTLGFFGARGTPLRARFCELLGVVDPGISWLAARDRIAEAGAVLAMIAGTAGRIGNEVYQLQRPEIGELAEAPGPGTVGSITMPHKRNPEVSEQLVTLARLARANAAVLLEGMVGEHERDARGWKAEWVALPEVCLLAGTAASLCRRMVDELEVDTAAMARGVAATRGRAASEQLLAALAPRLGKHAAQELLQRVLVADAGSGRTLLETVAGTPELAAHLDDDLRAALEGPPATGSAGEMVDEVLARARRARAPGRDG